MPATFPQKLNGQTFFFLQRQKSRNQAGSESVQCGGAPQRAAQRIMPVVDGLNTEFQWDELRELMNEVRTTGPKQKHSALGGHSAPIILFGGGVQGPRRAVPELYAPVVGSEEERASLCGAPSAPIPRVKG